MSIDKFFYLWEVKNPQYFALPVGQTMDSPKFCVPQFRNTEWYLRILLLDNCIYPVEKTKCFLFRAHDNGPETIEIKYSLSISTKNQGSETKTSKWRFAKNKSGDRIVSLPETLDAYEKSVLITCEMHCELCSLSTTEERNSSNINDLKFPIKCFTQSKIIHATNSIQQFIDPLINGSVSTMTIPLIFPEKYPSLTISLQNSFVSTFRDEIERKIDVNIGLKNGSFQKPSIVSCEISATNHVGQMIYIFEGKHKFIAGANKNWCLQKMTETHFKAYINDFALNKINLKGRFTISVGATVSEISSVEYIKVVRNQVSSQDYIPSDEIFSLIKDKKLCDFSLKVGNDVIEVHKIVLAAASPVFAAMVTNEMAEKKNNFVDIVDVDKETVEEMVSFMYTGSVKDLEYESAKKLFIAGDKYQMSPLLYAARNVIISFINCDTICDILALADTHNDKELEEVAVKFVKSNKTCILSSLKWASFESENENLAAKVMKQVCLQNKTK